MTHLNSLGSRYFHSYVGDHQADWKEKTGEFCNFFGRVAFGKKIVINAKDYHVKVSCLAQKIFAGLASILFCGLFLVGTTLLKASKSHLRAYDRVINIDKIKNHTLLKSQIKGGDKSSPESTHHDKYSTIQIQSKEQAIEVFNELSKTFMNYYLSGPHVLKNKSSKHYGMLLKLAEDTLLAAEQVSRECPGSENNLQFMREKFEELYKNIPMGESILLQRDIDRVISLTRISPNKTYTNHLGTFYEPQISLFNLVIFFNKFKDKYGYEAIYVAMKQDSNFQKPIKNMRTSIEFKIKKETPKGFFSFISKPNKHKANIPAQLQALVELIKPQMEKWAYAYCEVGHDEYLKNDPDTEGFDLSHYGAYVYLYHKRVPALERGNEVNSEVKDIPQENRIKIMDNKFPEQKTLDNKQRVHRLAFLYKFLNTLCSLIQKIKLFVKRCFIFRGAV